MRKLLWTIAAALLVLPASASALGLGLELGSTTRWQQSQGDQRLGQEGTAGVSFAATWALAPSLRAELLWRTFDEDSTGPAGMNVSSAEHQVGIAINKAVVARSFWQLEGRGGVGASWRRLELSDYSGGYQTADWRGWAPFVEVGGALQLHLPKTVTRERYELGVRLELGWQHVVARDVNLTVRSAMPEGTTSPPVALGGWAVTGPAFRYGVFVRF